MNLGGKTSLPCISDYIESLTIFFVARFCGSILAENVSLLILFIFLPMQTIILEVMTV